MKVFTPRFDSVRCAFVRRGMCVVGGLLWCALAAPRTAPAAPLPVPSGIFVTSGSAQAPQVNGNAMVIKQFSPQATFNWDQFNIDRGYAVNFSQPGKDSVALNLIKQRDPVQIRGALTATGEVWLLNQNGIVFGDGAQVNVRGLVASSLTLSPQAAANGIAPANAQSFGAAPTFESARDPVSGAALARDVRVEAGAQLHTNGDGGRLFLFAPNVTNEGTLVAPDGQVALAAGTEIYIRQPQSGEGSGLVVEVGNGGVVRNGSTTNATVTDPAALLGQVVADHGTATLVGLAVNQLGRVSASSAVKANGTVRLLARNAPASGDGLLNPVEGGSIVLGRHSVTAADPDPADTTTAVDASALQAAQVLLAGKSVHLEGESTLVAQGGNIRVVANETGDETAGVGDPAAASESRIVMEAGSRIDVSGADTTVDGGRNALTVRLQGAELKDLPLQRDGILRGETVTVDLRRSGTRSDGTTWIGTPLADLRSSAAADVKRSNAERNSTGGSVELRAQGGIVTAIGSGIDVSGGTVHYSGATLQTTLLMRQGRLVDIGDADPDIAYEGVYGRLERTHAKWGGRDQWTLFSDGAYSGRFVEAYDEGRDAGSISLVAPGLVLQGDLIGGTRAGTNQRTATDLTLALGIARPSAQLPRPGRLTLGNGNVTAQSPQYVTPDVIFGDPGTAPGLTDFDIMNGPLPASARTVHLDPAWFGAGRLGRLEILSEGRVSLPAGVTLDLGPGGSAAITAGEVRIDGALTAPAGTLNLLARETSDGVGATASTGTLALGAHARLDVSGLWTNDSAAQPADAGAPAAPLLPDGGTIALTAQAKVPGTGGLFAAEGSVIRADGAGSLSRQGKLAAGKGGTISIGVQTDSASAPFPVAFQVDSELTATALSRGGTLKLRAWEICIADAVCDGSAVERVTLRPTFFTSGGFGRYELTAAGSDLTLADDVRIAPRQENFVLGAAYRRAPSGRAIREFSTTATLDDYARRPVDLAFIVKAQSPLNLFDDAALRAAGALRLGARSSIAADAGAALSFTSETRLFADGAIAAPGGSISLTLASGINGSRLLEFLPSQQIRLGAGALLSTGGSFVSKPNVRGLASGTLFDGGTITLDAESGYVIAETGALLDVSGASAALDVAVPGDLSGQPRRVLTASAAGAIMLRAAEGLYVDAVMRAQAGGAGARAGSLTFALDAQHRNDAGDLSVADLGLPIGPRVVNLVAGAPGLPAALVASEAAIDPALNGRAILGAERLAAAGFGDISLQARNYARASGGGADAPGEIAIAGGVELAATRRIVLDSAVLRADTGRVSIAAPYVALGNQDTNADAANIGAQTPGVATGGAGCLDVSADFIDLIGTLRLGGVASSTFTSRGDIRVRGVQVVNVSPLVTTYTGSLESAGDLHFAARELYPATLSDYRIASVDNPAGTITFDATGAAGTVYSVGGTLRVEAPFITQRGNLAAPLGGIALRAADTLMLAPGSTTSTSLRGVTTLFGRIEVGKDWVYTLDGFKDASQARLVFTPQANREADPFPTSRVLLDAPAVDLAAGATIDESGGGDLLAYEFQPGLNGSVDALAIGNAPGTYAILPSAGAAYAPYDPQEFRGFDLAPGESLELTGAAPGLPAGRYALLPARYALLPGAQLVTALDGYAGLAAGTSRALAGGGTLVAGRRTFATGQEGDVLSAGFLLRGPTEVAKLARYDLSSADGLAALGASRLPRDGGILQIAAGHSLALGGRLLAAPAIGGRGAEAEFAGAHLAVVRDANRAPPEPGTLLIDAGGLMSLGADSLVLGGTRTTTSSGRLLGVNASDVEIRPGVALTAPEILLAATDRVTLAGGSSLTASGTGAASAGTLAVDGDGAVLRVASGGQVDFVRNDELGTTGTLDIQADARVVASGAVLLDASLDTLLDGTLAMTGGSLNLAAPRLSLGATAGVTEGLALSTALLAGLDVDQLVLTSRRGIDVYGALDLAFKRLVLAAPGLAGYADAGEIVRLAADSIELGNRGGFDYVPPAGAIPGAGTLELRAGSFGLGKAAGEGFRLIGFAQTGLAAGDAFHGTGTGRLLADGDLAVSAPAFTVAAGATSVLAATGRLDLTSPTAPVSPVPGVSGTLEVEAARIFDAANLLLPAGSITLHATGAATTDSVVLGATALLDVSGVAVDFGSSSAFAPAGRVHLQADHGDVGVTSGARMRLGGASGGGAAGSLDISAPQGQVTGLEALDVVATATPGAAQGSLGLDVLTFASPQGFADLLATFGARGFTESLHARVRSGDVTLAAGDTAIRAHDFALVVDGGALAIDRSIDASGANGGRIRVAAAGDITLAAGVALDAAAGATGAAGGEVWLGTNGASDGTAAAGAIRLVAGSLVDVAGGVGGAGGRVGLRLPRASLLTLANADDADDLLRLDGTIAGSASTVVEGFRAYTDANGISAGEAAATADTAGNVSGAATSTSVPTTLTSARNGLYAGLTIRFTSGNLTGRTALITAYDAATKRLTVSGLAGTPANNSQFVIDGNAIYTDAVAFMNQAGDITTALGAAASNTGFHLRPGLEIRSASADIAGTASDLALNAIWDLSTWRFGGEAGVLTLRAAGNLDVNESLSDGFTGTDDLARTATNGTATRCANPASCSARPTATPVFETTGDSWSYRLVAGADLGSADPLTTLDAATSASARGGAGNVRIAGGVASVTNGLRPILTAVRTGTGAIDIAAGGAFTLANRAAVVYTAGRDTQLGIALGTNSPTSRATLQGRPYPEFGGDIRIDVGGDIDGVDPALEFATSSTEFERQLVTSWLFRQGNIGTTNRATGWTIAPEYFEQGIGALAGGSVSLHAGGDIDNVSASVATIGRQLGGATAALSTLEVLGGGTLDITSGGSIRGGVYYVGAGAGRLTAGGGLGASRPLSTFSDAPLYPILALGAASFVVEAGGDVNLGAIVNPTMVPQGAIQKQGGINARFNSYFFTYGAESAVAATSLAGNVTLVDPAPLASGTFDATFSNVADAVSLRALPPRLALTALGGDVTLSAAATLLPSAAGNLELRAGRNVALQRSLALSDGDALLLPGVATPQAFNTTAGDDLLNSLFDADNPAALTAAVPVHLQAAGVHQNSAEVIALEGDITSAQNAVLFLSRPALLRAGRDIVNLDAVIENLDEYDVSLVEAGRDFVYQSPRIATNALIGAPGALLVTTGKLDVWGPGRLLVTTGRDLDLGTAGGIVSHGDNINGALADTGAAITAFVGLNGARPDFAAFTARYLGDGDYAALVTDFARGYFGDRGLAAGESFTRFRGLPGYTQAGVVLDAFFSELRATGRAAAASTTGADYGRGVRAAATLFPGRDYAGDVNLYFSQIFTFDGGNIDLLAPGGNVNVGLATPPASFGINKAPADLGIVTEGRGDIRSYLAQDFEVNESRVFAADGGSILVWSAHGDIDAGRGAKSAISVPATGFQFDNQGHLTVTVPPPIQGSGIRALTTTPGREFGSVDLVTPEGVVNASEAGIESAGNITIAAVQVLGAENIKAGGTAVGVPTASVGGVSSSVAGAGGAASSAAKAASDAAAGGGERGTAATQPLAASKLSMFYVEFLGFGG
ncbi:MAG: filamentous hemagglutinin family protein [Gammaproteobacteria bacterium]|nr:filamentous hemagglutinin family protein [Gammaproteobacteria bacterium]